MSRLLGFVCAVSIPLFLGCAESANPPAPASSGAAVQVDPHDGDVSVDVDRPGMTRDSHVDVDVKPGAGVDVNVEGTPVRDAIREIREERQENAAAKNP